MKKTFLLFVILLITANLFTVCAQKKDTVPSVKKWTDVGFFIVDRFDQSKNRPILWFSHEEGKYFVEERMNFDWKETGGIFIGKTFSKSKKFWITPKMGFLVAMNELGYNGLSPEFNLGGTFGKINYFVMNQMAISFDSKNPNFLYNYSQIGYKCCKWLSANYAAQFYCPTGSHDVWIDQGPQLVLSVDKFYLKPWYTWDPVHQEIEKVIVGLGYRF